jgi:hypothetical protein
MAWLEVLRSCRVCYRRERRLITARVSRPALTQPGGGPLARHAAAKSLGRRTRLYAAVANT